eukprot:76267_1
MFIYAKDIDYYNHKDELLECHSLLQDASYLSHTSYDWHSAFWNHANTNNITVNPDTYYDTLHAFTDTIGIGYKNVIAWKNESQPSEGISGSFMFGEIKESKLDSGREKVDLMNTVRDDVEDIVGKDDRDKIFPFAYDMIWWEQFAVIQNELYRNLLLAVCVIFVITLIFIPKVSVALSVFVVVCCTIVDVLGMMWLWGLTIDGITVCYTVISIGLSVDYSAHIGEAFMLSNKQSKNHKIVDALFRVGASVFNGAFSTFLAVVVLATGKTYILKIFFRQFFLVTVFGSFHGLIVLPALLSVFQPDSVNDENTEDKEQKDEINI